MVAMTSNEIPRKQAHISQWWFLGFAIAFPFVLAIPSWAYRECFTLCIPEIVGALFEIQGFIFWPTLAIFIGLFFWSLKKAQREYRTHIILVGIITSVIGIGLFYFSLLMNMFLFISDFSKVAVPETGKIYYVEQIASLPEGYGFRLYEKNGLFKRHVAWSRWRWHSIQESGASIELLPISGEVRTFVFNVETKNLTLK